MDPLIHFSRVDLPEPLLPVTASEFPWERAKLRFLKIHSNWKRFDAPSNWTSSILIDVALHHSSFGGTDKIQNFVSFLSRWQVDFNFL